MAGFETRPLGRTSLRVTVLGLGTGSVGGHRIPVSRQQGEAVVRAAWSAGVRYFDTAPFYGFGQACRLLGDAMRELPRDKWLLSTKVGRLLRPQLDEEASAAMGHPMPFREVFDYSYAGVMRSFEDSGGSRSIVPGLASGQDAGIERRPDHHRDPGLKALRQ